MSRAASASAKRSLRRGQHHGRETGRPNAVERGEHRPLAAVERGVFAEEQNFRHDVVLPSPLGEGPGEGVANVLFK